MLKYKELNLNPKKYLTNDSTIQVIAYLLGISWEQALDIQAKVMLKYKFGPDSTALFRYILKHVCKLKKYKPTCLNYYETPTNVRHLDQEFSKQFMKENIIICQTKAHCLIIDDGYYIDKFDAAEEVVKECYYKHKI